MQNEFKINNKGFTLIEIIMSLAIGSIVLLVVGALLISSFNLVSKYTNSDLKKKINESVKEYVRDQIKTSTEVLISKELPINNDEDSIDYTWKCMYISDDKLYNGVFSEKSETDTIVFDDTFYLNNASTPDEKANKLEIKVTNSNAANVQSTFKYTLKNDEDTAKVNDTFSFGNLTKKSGTSFTNVYKDFEVDSFKDFDLNLDKNGGYKLFYTVNEDKVVKQGSSTIIQKEKARSLRYNSTTGTVKDKIYLMNTHRRLGYDQDADGRVDTGRIFKYYVGDFVYWDGYWYLKVVDSSSNTSGPSENDGTWQRMDDEYDENSKYITRDRVFGDNKTHNGLMMLGSVIYEFDGSKWNAKSTSSLSQGGYEKVDAYYDKITVSNNSPARFINELSDSTSTDIKVYDTTYEDISGLTEWRSSNKYATVDKPTTSMIENYCYVTNPSDHTFQYLYRKVFDTATNLEPGKEDSGWELVENFYSDKSSYLSGDVIRYPYRSSSGTDESNIKKYSYYTLKLLNNKGKELENSHYIDKDVFTQLWGNTSKYDSYVAQSKRPYISLSGNYVARYFWEVKEI